MRLTKMLYNKRQRRRKNIIKDDYEVNFLYPGNNLSFQKLLKAAKSYEEFKNQAYRSLI